MFWRLAVETRWQINPGVLLRARIQVTNQNWGQTCTAVGFKYREELQRFITARWFAIALHNSRLLLCEVGIEHKMPGAAIRYTTATCIILTAIILLFHI